MAVLQFLICHLATVSLEVVSAFDPLGGDLATFVTRPDLKPPRLNVTTHIPELVTPGYWFYTPYDSRPVEYTPRAYVAGQTGPHIFDDNGSLIWSGAPEFGLTGSTSDFKVVQYHGESYLSFIRDPRVTLTSMFEGEGIIMDPSYSVEKRIRIAGGDGGFNMHEFQVINNGASVIVETGDRKLVDFNRFGLELGGGYLSEAIFMEIDVASNKQLFTWHSTDHVSPNESYTHQEAFNKAWDYFHLNSIDKNAEGDYLISARYTSTIYKISGKDGSVIWRLGGPQSDFVLMGFNFSSQHHARFWHESGTTSTISFLNNASDRSKTNNKTADWSSAFLVTVDTSTKRATLTRSWDRPDHKLTRLRGAVQMLSSTSVFVSWSDNGYTSEFTMDGKLVQEAKFASDRFVDYRAYKFNFTARPAELPVVKALVYGASKSVTTTAIYVSWNGATEVKSWRFYGTRESGGQSSVLLGEVTKTGFETVFVVPNYVQWIFAEGVAKDGTVLGQSLVQAAEIIFEWNATHTTSPALASATHEHAHTAVSDTQKAHSTTGQGVQLVPGTAYANREFPNVCVPQREVSLGVSLTASLISGLLFAATLNILTWSRHWRSVAKPRYKPVRV